MPARKFTVLFQKDALKHLQNAIEYYNSQQKGLGKRFGLAVFKTAETLQTNPFFQVRYQDIRCLLIPKFPYMIHFSIDENLKKVRIYALLHTSVDPTENWKK